MKIVNLKNLEKDRIINCPKGGFISNRILLESDEMGYTLTKTIVPVNGKQYWHYKNHLETCYCIAGKGILTNKNTGEQFNIESDIVYILDKNDPHFFEALEECILICVFNPPLTGKEVHKEDGSY